MSRNASVFGAVLDFYLSQRRLLISDTKAKVYVNLILYIPQRYWNLKKTLSCLAQLYQGEALNNCLNLTSQLRIIPMTTQIETIFHAPKYLKTGSNPHLSGSQAHKAINFIRGSHLTPQLCQS